MHAPLLPPALLDLISLRTSLRSNTLSHVAATACRSSDIRARHMHQAALATVPSHDTAEVGQSLYGRRRVRRRRDGALSVRPVEGISPPMSELERRVQSLQNTVVQEESINALGGLSEEELLDIYQDLLAIPSSEVAKPTNELSETEQDQALVHAVEQRLFGAAPVVVDGLSRIASVLQQNRHATTFAYDGKAECDGTEDTGDHMTGHGYRRVLSRLQSIISRLNDTQLKVAPGSHIQDSLPVGIVSDREWLSLVRVCIHEQDGGAAELAIDLIKRSGASVPEEALNHILALYADQGDVTRTENFMATALTESPTNRQRDLHVKSHLRASPSNAIPETALSVLHNYELQSIPAPMRTYTRLITALFSTKSSIGHAQAWDLFTHMRYVAHPNPDAQLYTQMIRACASSLVSSAEPERALDLWTEMTVDHGIAPSAGAYTAVILACARSGSKTYIHEAFRLAKEMLDSHRDARGRSAFKPDGKTFCALLEGAKRVGDLARARWILAEMVRGNDNGADNGFVDARITEEVMMHVFHAYASYTVPFKRTAAPLVDQKVDSNTQRSSLLDDSVAAAQPVAQTSPAAESVSADQTQAGLPSETNIPSFSHLPPQSRSEVIGEARALFTRIMDDAHAAQPSFTPEPTGKFGHVNLTPRLVNSYLSVHYKHGSLDACRRLFWSVFEDLGVPRNVRSFVEALERCATARRGTERDDALSFAEELWAQWVLLENGEHQDVQDPANARMIERANIAVVRLWTLSGNLERAFGQVKSFTQRYPPVGVRQPPAKLPFQSTRTVLLGSRPLVRMTSATELPDDTVPPLLTFTDIELLHHRLVAAGKKKEIGFLKYTCKAYEGGLRIRRDATMRAEPARV